MNNQIAIALVLIILAAFAADYFWLNFGLPVFLGKQFTNLVSFLVFWD